MSHRAIGILNVAARAAGLNNFRIHKRYYWTDRTCDSDRYMPSDGPLGWRIENEGKDHYLGPTMDAALAALKSWGKDDGKTG